jgi:sugar phosphate isomerase/epimerase
VVAQLAWYCEPVRQRLGTSRLGIGLWLAADVVAGLSEDESALRSLRGELRRRGLEVVTLNAFPYRGFHEASVKKAVYLPDWSDPARLGYTLACARILASLLPDDAAGGSVSTLPLAWRGTWRADQVDDARRNIAALAGGLASLARETGRPVRVGFEPEPGCLVETMGQAQELMRDVSSEWLGVCLDLCHLAVGFETPARAAQLPVVKAQVSNAVQADDPADPPTQAALRRFDEPRFLHQTREIGPHGVMRADDLADALDGRLPGRGPWRVHFHVPLHAELPPPLRTTRPELLAGLETLVGGEHALTDHLEVETYTWSVLPDPPSDTVTGIAAELTWARGTLRGLGLAEEEP